MKHINIEIKAKCFHLEMAEAFFIGYNAKFAGVDLQKDIYFNIPSGRLKLRKAISRITLFFTTEIIKRTKQPDFYFATVIKPLELESVLTHASGIKVVVEKKRKIFFLITLRYILMRFDLGNFI